MTATVHRLPVLRPGLSGRPRSKAAARVLAAVLGPLLLVGGMIHAAGSDARALTALPAETRAALYARTVQNLQSVCSGDARSALPDFCHDQAQLALAFPECDAACAHVARAALRTPTR